MKTIILSVSIVLCASVFTSCATKFEKAYEAECNYRLAKDGVCYEVSDTLKFHREFVREYESMDVLEKQRYSSYRMNRKAEEEREWNKFQEEQQAIASMLND